MNRVFDDVYSHGRGPTDLKSTTPAAGHPDKSSPVQMSRVKSCGHLAHKTESLMGLIRTVVYVGIIGGIFAYTQTKIALKIFRFRMRSFHRQSQE